MPSGKSGSLTEPGDWRYMSEGAELPLLHDGRRYPHCQILPLLRRTFPDGRGMSFLEAGCTPGRYGAFFSRELGFDSVAGIDSSPEGVLLTRANWNSLGIRGEVLLGDVLDPPGHFRGSFDAVLSAGLVEHFERPEAVVAVLVTLLLPGGILVTVVPNTAPCLQTALMRRMNPAGYRRLPANHVPMGMRQLEECHGELEIILRRRIAGVLTDFVTPTGQRPSRATSRAVRLLNRLTTLLSGVLQTDRLASNLLLIARKPGGRSQRRGAGATLAPAPLLVRPPGIEPGTYGLRVRCSAN